MSYLIYYLVNGEYVEKYKINIDEEELKRIKSGALIIDLASYPGGVDFEKAKELGVKTIHALSLPGKVAPKSAGEIIESTILSILKEDDG